VPAPSPRELSAELTEGAKELPSKLHEGMDVPVPAPVPAPSPRELSAKLTEGVKALPSKLPEGVDVSAPVPAPSPRELSAELTEGAKKLPSKLPEGVDVPVHAPVPAPSPRELTEGVKELPSKLPEGMDVPVPAPSPRELSAELTEGVKELSSKLPEEEKRMEVKPVARIVIVGTSEASRTQLSRLLASSGHSVYRSCASGGELRRTLTECEDGIVIISGGMPDRQPDDIAADFGDAFQFLLIGRPEALEACESARVFKLTYPCSGSAVMGAVEMLSQLHYMRMPHRSGADRRRVEDAKRLLMQRYRIDEPEAHRRMQQYAMRHGIKMTEYAWMILQGGMDDA
ncbi:MAG: ANTAR domain-containing protein, partial [Clostridia bacterium]|nr:ANTAR domain-containing protein [Clostridia bacterium]